MAEALSNMATMWPYLQHVGNDLCHFSQRALTLEKGREGAKAMLSDPYQFSPIYVF